MQAQSTIEEKAPRRWFPWARPKASLEASDLADWERDGYLVLPGFFDAERIARAGAEIERFWEERSRPDNPLVMDAFIGTSREQRMAFRDAGPEARHEPYKLNDTYLCEASMRDLALDPRLVGILTQLVEGQPAICNTLNFEFGSEQALHFDTFYMDPPPGGRMVVTSICLEDVHPDAGPLTYVPGSHKISPTYNADGTRHARNPQEHEVARRHAEAAIAERGLEQVDFPGKAGDVFIWHEQLYHGGRPINDRSRTRRTLVTHYWRAEQLADMELEPWGKGAWYIQRAHQPVPSPPPAQES